MRVQGVEGHLQRAVGGPHEGALAVRLSAVAVHAGRTGLWGALAGALPSSEMEEHSGAHAAPSHRSLLHINSVGPRPLNRTTTTSCRSTELS